MEEQVKVSYKLDSLYEESTKFLYQIRLASKLAEIGTDCDCSNTVYENLKRCIHEAASAALGKEIRQNT
nr:unnamed protein product [Callosobruchus analis]